VLNTIAAAADGGDDVSGAGCHADDEEECASICCDCLSTIAKAFKLASLNRDCSIAEVGAAAASVWPDHLAANVFLQISSSLDHVILSVTPFPSCSSSIQDLKAASATVRSRQPAEKNISESGGHAAAAQVVKTMKTMQVPSGMLPAREQ
jgi:hypothetical protein